MHRLVIFALSILLQSSSLTDGRLLSYRTTHPSPPTVTVRNGTYIGVHNSHYAQDYFLGIPYAQPPLGNLRFRPPVSLNDTWHDSKPAQTYSPECVGYGGDDIGYTTSEDCLTLNVIRPSNTGDGLPVVVWIHGGGLVMGGSVDRRYNLSFIVQNSVYAETPIIGVSINYRLSGWGFLWGDAVGDAGSGNVGLKDQRLALQWIQENIAAFGGDPSQVTIWGESSGAISIGTHLLAYGGRDDGLFRAAIMESGGPAGTQFTNNSLANYKTLLNETGCADDSNSLQCLRKLPFSTLNAVLNNTQCFSANSEIQSTQLRDGRFVKVPILIGTNTDEGSSFGVKGLNTTADFNKAISANGPDNATISIIDLMYPDIDEIGIPSTYHGPLTPSLGAQFKRSAAFYGDIKMHFPRRLTSLTWAHHNVPAYTYRFNVIVNGVALSPAATHFQEVAFAFDNLEGLGYAVNPFENEPASFGSLAKLMSRMWVAFVVSMDPNRNGLENAPFWPVYHNATVNGLGKNIVFDANVTLHAEGDAYRAEAIAYLISIAATQLHQ
ncbi:triacylglycerol lipase [Xylogone sp. PMI_703]|nr:triacylglycerol lipase [Xylogone sp. PMI_703]